MKKVLIVAAIVAVWFAIFILPSILAPKKEKYYCPFCDTEIEYEIDPIHVAEWLENKYGFIVLTDDEKSMNEFINYYVLDFMNDEGWLVIPPGDKLSDYDTTDWE